MKTVPAAKSTILGWPSWPTLKEQQQIRDLNREKKSGKNAPEGEKETPEQMIRSLQGAFCGGRYRSWLLSRERPQITTTTRK
jgi:hypothetical protein